MSLLLLPEYVICELILPYLSVRDMQSLHSSYTTKVHRYRLIQSWKSYDHCSLVTYSDMIWLLTVGAAVERVLLDNTIGDHFTADTITYIATNVPSLKQLHVGFPHQLTNGMLSEVAHGCPELEVLHIKFLSRITSEGIAELLQNCRKLHTLHLRGRHITDETIQVICDNCPNLRHIGLIPGILFSNDAILRLASTFPQLRSIDMHLGLRDEGLIHLANHCHELQSISMNCRNHITINGLTALWVSNPNIANIDISFTTFLSDENISLLAQCCPKLQKINLAKCSLITDNAISILAQHCPHLSSIYLRGCSSISSEALIALGSRSRSLKTIDISHLRLVTDVGIVALAFGCQLLEEFLACYTIISDSGVAALAKRCRYLKKVQIYCCPSIGFVGVSSIAENCPLISELALSGCYVNDACLYAIARHCRNIVMLYINYDNISHGDAVRTVLASCRYLQLFTVTNYYSKLNNERQLTDSYKYRKLSLQI